MAEQFLVNTFKAAQQHAEALEQELETELITEQRAEQEVQCKPEMCVCIKQENESCIRNVIPLRQFAHFVSCNMHIDGSGMN